MVITHLRKYHAEKTTSRLFVNGVMQSREILEDAGRPLGVKIPGQTPIPEGCYRVKITPSPKFGKPMLILYNVAADLSISRHGVKFTGVRVHAGNKVEHTDGCPLYELYEQLQATIQQALSAGEEVLWVVAEDVAC